MSFLYNPIQIHSRRIHALSLGIAWLRPQGLPGRLFHDPVLSEIWIMTLTGALQGQVPIKCKRLFPNYEHHRQDLKDSVRRQLEKDGKRLLKLRVL
jgi:hypothetical protein